MHVAVTGASGLLGSALVPRLTSRGDTVSRLVRREPTADDEVQWDPEGGRLDPAALRGVDAVVHLAGHPIGAHRWTAAEKRRLHDSRTVGTGKLAEAIAGLDDGPRTLVCASGIHYYGDGGDADLDETSPPGSGFLSRVVQDWEAAADPARDAGIRVVHVRAGLVQDPAGGALGKILPLFKLGLGGRLGSGRQWWSWISGDDVIGVYLHALTTEDLSGPVNATAPHPVTNADYTRTLGRVLGRPTLLPVPKSGPKVVLGSEMAEELLFTSAKVQPVAAEKSGYAFRHVDLEPALRELLDRPGR